MRKKVSKTNNLRMTQMGQNADRGDKSSKISTR